jgi:hypothetical protein
MILLIWNSRTNEMLTTLGCLYYEM